MTLALLKPWPPLPLMAASLAACASGTAGAQPQDMSIAQHQAMATNEEKIGETHAQQYQPGAAVQTERCGFGGRASTSVGGFDGGCWTSVRNPTAEHIEEALKHRRMAADHRAASMALLDAEAHACAGLSPDDRDMSPFEHRDDIAGVKTLFGGGCMAKLQRSKARSSNCVRSPE